jgi:ribonuclease BN (tRNA processing enzyme)
MRLTVLGSNGTYPTAGHPASGYLVQADHTSVLVDCGPGVFPVIHASGSVPDAIVLSHGHGDHCLDLLPLFNHLRFDRPEVRSIPLYAPDGVVQRLAAFAGAGPDHDFFAVFDPVHVAPGDAYGVGTVTVSFGEAVHPVPAVVTRLEAGGSVLTYSGDTGPGGDVTELAAGADVLLCEATHQGMPAPDRYPFHLYAVEAGEVAARAGVARLIVTHVSPTLDPAVSVSEAASSFDGPVTHAEPRMEIEW